MDKNISWIRGFDVTSLLETEKNGAKFYDGGVQGDALEILKSYGGNWVRLRLWNDPYSESGEPYGAGDCDEKTLVTLAKRAKALGYKWLLDLHYSDFWADPGKQIVPKAWRSLDADGLEAAVGVYTAEILELLRDAGVSPDMVQVGNELSNGLLWPLGRVPEWDNIYRFVMAGVRSVREFNPDIPIMIHLDNGGNNELYRTWFDNFKARGGDWDVIGLSYYPFWHGGLADLANNMNDIAGRYGKPLIIAEASMGYTLEDYGAYEKLEPENRKGAAANEKLAAKVEFPMTKEGQANFTKALIETIKAVPKDLGRGLFWWEAAWIPTPGSGWANRAGWEYVGEKGPGGNEWANQALFDYEGNSLPALKTIRDN